MAAMDVEEDMDEVVVGDDEVSAQEDPLVQISTDHLIDPDETEEAGDAAMPAFAPISAMQAAGGKQFRRVLVPAHRYTPLRDQWMDIYTPVVEQMLLQIRFNPKRRCVELKTSPKTQDSGAIQKCSDFLRAFMLGFDVKDAIALLRLEDLYVDSFEIRDVKTLEGDHLSRAIGRICGQAGKTKFTIENTTKTRVVIADAKIHVLGAFQNIKIARDMIVRLILGSPPGKVYNMMRNIASRQRERF